jgi:hypothetical protein
MSRDKLEKFNINTVRLPQKRQCKFCDLPGEAHSDLGDILDGTYPLTQFETLSYMIQEFNYDGSMTSMLDHIKICLHCEWGPRRYRSNNGV